MLEFSKITQRENLKIIYNLYFTFLRELIGIVLQNAIGILFISITPESMVLYYVLPQP